jgi:hypothetical protein
VTVIAIQSQVVHGHVGNSAAVFPLQACGLEVAAVPTTLLSNHPHHSSMRGGVLDAELVRDLLMGVEERGLVDTCKILISGFLGSAAIAAVVIDFVRRAKAQPKTSLSLRPGHGRRRSRLLRQRRHPRPKNLIPIADIITNQFELEHLVGRTPATVEGMVAAGLSTVVVTGAHFQVSFRPWRLNPGPPGWWQRPGLPPAHRGPAICSPRFSPPRCWRACRPRPRSAAPFPVKNSAAAVLQDGAGGFHGAPVAPRSPLRAVRYPATRGCSALAGSSRRIPMTSVAMLKRIPQ